MFAQDSTEAGELLLSLCYLPAVERLTVTVIKARNLKPMDISGTSGGYSMDTLRISDTHTRESQFFCPPLLLDAYLYIFVYCTRASIDAQILTWNSSWFCAVGAWRSARRRCESARWTRCSTSRTSSTCPTLTSSRSCCSSPFSTTTGVPSRALRLMHSLIKLPPTTFALSGREKTSLGTIVRLWGSFCRI